MKVLLACEESQTVCTEFRKLGHEAYSCDILETSGLHPEWHIRKDVSNILGGKCEFYTQDGKLHVINAEWDLIIGFPPCTYLSNAGARHLYPNGVLNEERYQKGLEAKEFFLKIFNAECEHIAVENPVSSRVYNMPPHAQEIQPYQFGHLQKKKTRLWLKNLPCLTPTNIVEPTENCHGAGWYTKGGKDRQRKRSKTFLGIAKAMAEQWSEYIENIKEAKDEPIRN